MTNTLMPLVFRHALSGVTGRLVISIYI